jgi:hypothetical protein
MVGKKNTFDGGTAQRQKELQDFAAFVTYQEVVNRGDSITNYAQQDWIGDAFFVTPPILILSVWPNRLSMVLGFLVDFPPQLTILSKSALEAILMMMVRFRPSAQVLVLLAPAPTSTH